MMTSRRVVLVGHVARMGEMRNAYKLLESLKGSDQSDYLKLVDNIKMDLREIVYGVGMWIGFILPGIS
jgi:hypothetical protein